MSADTDPEADPRPFRYDAEVPVGEKRHLRYEISQTYTGDPVELPITVTNGAEAGPTVFLTAAVHGDELNGVKVCQEVAARYDPADVHGTIVCLHVVNVPGYNAQQRYIPIYDQDLNRAFPGRATSNTAGRMAHEIYERFLKQCDLGIDFHTSTRNRTTMFHLRADLTDPGVERLAHAFGANVVLSGAGEAGSVRRTATADGIPTVTVEMGKAHRFQRPLIEKGVAGVESVLAEYGVLPDREPVEPAWRKVTPADGEKRWLRADAGGLVDMQWGPEPLVQEGETICTVTDHFGRRERVVAAPFTGLMIGALENPVAMPGHPLCHLVRIGEDTKAAVESEIEAGTFDGYRAYGARWLGPGEEAE